MLKTNVKDNFQGQGLELAVHGQGQNQGLGTQGQGQVRGQLASRILEAKTISSRTPSLMCIKCILYSVHYATSSLINNYDCRIGEGVLIPPGPSLLHCLVTGYYCKR